MENIKQSSEIKEPFCSFCSFPYPSHHPNCPKSLENSKKGGKEIEKRKALEEKPISDEEWFKEKKKQYDSSEEIWQEKIKPQVEQKKEKRETKKVVEEPSQGHKITDEEIDGLISGLFNKPSIKVEKIIPKQELKKKKGEEVKETIDNIWGFLQNEIGRLKEKMDDRQKKYLKNYIKSILKGYLIKEFKNLENIEDIRLSRGDWLISEKRKIFQTITSELKERILSKYGYSSDIMKIFQDAVKEMSENKDIDI